MNYISPHLSVVHMQISGGELFLLKLINVTNSLSNYNKCNSIKKA